jgi:hypothetical protein
MGTPTTKWVSGTLVTKSQKKDPLLCAWCLEGPETRAGTDSGAATRWGMPPPHLAEGGWVSCAVRSPPRPQSAGLQEQANLAAGRGEGTQAYWATGRGHPLHPPTVRSLRPDKGAEGRCRRQLLFQVSPGHEVPCPHPAAPRVPW